MGLVAGVIKGTGVLAVALTIMGIMVDPQGTADTWQSIGQGAMWVAGKGGTFFTNLTN